MKDENKHHVLLVEDDIDFGNILKQYLEITGYYVTWFKDGEEALNNIKSNIYNICVLDVMMPKIDGFTLAKEIRAFNLNIPLLFLTAKSMKEDKIKGFKAGADDYVTKPFSPKELIARIKAVIRRVSPTSIEETIEFHGLSLDPVAHRVAINERKLDLGPTEFRLLHFFMTHTERVYSREQLLDNVWGTNVFVEDRTVDVHIRRLRKAISGDGHEHFIQTVRGSRYRFSGQVSQ